jgi:hypothetical protein
VDSNIKASFQKECLFPDIKKHLKGKEFSSIEEATLAADGWFSILITRN